MAAYLGLVMFVSTVSGFCVSGLIGVWVRAVQKECLDNGRAFYGFWVSAFLGLGMFLGLRVQGSWFLV